MVEVMVAEATKLEAAAEGGGTKRWYVVHAYSGMEKSVAKTLQERVDRAGLQQQFGKIMVPTEEVVEVKGGKRAITERRLYSGYVLVEMDMTDEAWHLVKSTPKVTGFLGGKANKPSPLPQKEVDEILLRMQEGYEKPRPKVLFEVGEMVRVRDGPFTDFNGNVEEVNYDKSRVRVSVTIFGRSTPVDLEFDQVEKV
jgi:transcriptional antiterminator NusG